MGQYLDDRRFRWAQAGRGVNSPQKFLLGRPAGHSNALRPATMVASCSPDHGMDRVAVLDGVVQSLDQQARAALTSPEPGGLLVVRETPALCRQSPET